MAASHPLDFEVPRRIADEVTVHLEWAIVYGDVEEGTRLREEDVSARYGVSRSPVREAFDSLVRDGLVTRLPRRGVSVPYLSRQDFFEIYAVRLSLEGQAAAEAASHHTEGDLDAMNRALADMQGAAKADDVRAFFRANLALSNAIYLATSNATLQRLLAIIEKQARRYRFVAFERRHNLIAKSIDGNRAIVATIAARDCDAAERTTRALIVNSRDELAGTFNERVESENG